MFVITVWLFIILFMSMKLNSYKLIMNFSLLTKLLDTYNYINVIAEAYPSP